MPSELTMAARKVLSRWAREDYYVYLRPINSVYVDPSRKPTTYWNVSVEFRTVEPVQRRGEGYNLSEIIMELDAQVPRRHKSQPGYKPGKPIGYLAPASVVKKEAQQRKSERPRKRPKSAKKKKRASHR